MSENNQVVNLRIVDMDTLRYLARQNRLPSHGTRAELILRLKPLTQPVFDFDRNDPNPMPTPLSPKRTHEQIKPKVSVAEEPKRAKKRRYEDLLTAMDYKIKISKLDDIEKTCDSEIEQGLEKEKFWLQKLSASRERRKMLQETCKEAQKERTKLKLNLKELTSKITSGTEDGNEERQVSQVTERVVQIVTKESSRKIVSTNKSGNFINERLHQKDGIFNRNPLYKQ